ncbi:hypothetical protein V6N12_020441 [Hibiscus sabdariffa]|uniref:Uncharacterized protein n=1 Tax=Hibiscus sabdariffa TaxID=183260 RepID=A0ABR2CY62_9ROSI
MSDRNDKLTTVDECDLRKHDVESVEDLSILERPESHVDLVNSHIAKKPRGGVPYVGIINGNATAEDVIMHPQHARVLASSSNNTSYFEEDLSLNIDDVVMFDDDCVLTDDGVFLTIKFSERVHEQIDKSLKNSIIV